MVELLTTSLLLLLDPLSLDALGDGGGPDVTFFVVNFVVVSDNPKLLEEIGTGRRLLALLLAFTFFLANALAAESGPRPPDLRPVGGGGPDGGGGRAGGADFALFLLRSAAAAAAALPSVLVVISFDLLGAGDFDRDLYLLPLVVVVVVVVVVEAVLRIGVGGP